MLNYINSLEKYIIVNSYVALNSRLACTTGQAFQGPSSIKTEMLKHLPGVRQELSMTFNEILV